MIAVETRKRRSNRHNRPGALLLAAVLVCALFAGTASAAPGNVNTFTLLKANESAPKPIVTIQGNVVVDKNKPTGYYELALCVQTGRVVRDDTGAIVADQLYADALKEAEEKNDQSIVTEFLKTHTVTYYPFQSAGAAVYVNLDVLTPVTWSADKPIYSEWDGTLYASADAQYPRGLDPNTPDQPNKMFSDLEPVINDKGDRVMVRLDTAKPDEVTNATALVEWAEFNTVDTSKRTALLTLTANTTTTPNVIYEKPTPVVVVRFAYDMERFENLEVGDPLGDQADPKNQNHSDFWLGLDKNSTLPSEGPGTNVDSAAQIPLTYLAASTTGGTNKYADSDAKAAASSVSQVVWYRANLNSDHIEQDETNFYYYLGAEDLARDPAQKVQIDNGTLTPDEPSLLMPKTVGDAAVAKKSAETELRTPGDPEPDANYSFFQNLLRRSDDTLRLHLVNAETYRKPTGGGGTTILFYDWDDTLIGSLVVDKGDVRAEVEEYIEENLVHPDLRPGTLLDKMGGKVDYSTPPAPGSDAQAYRELITSTERKDTYRGKYAYTVGGNDTVGAEGDTTNQGRADGADYPLTNKLDYVFTKRVNTELQQEVTDADGSYTARYILPHDPTDANMVDAALYPYTYGWAVVEDTSDKNQKNWKVMYDATKLEDTWTTVGVGELSEVDPDYYANGGAAKTMPAVTASDKYVAPAFLADEDENWTDNTAGLSGQAGYTDKYAYQLNSNGPEGYLRFADFSDIDTELALYKKKNGGNKDTLIVKAVYEPGKSLMNGNHYQLISKPAYTKFNVKSASSGAAYKVQLTLERSYINSGVVQGTTRVREPVIQQDTTIDAKWIADTEKGVNHDLDNPTFDVSNNRTQTLYTQVDVDNGEQIVFSLSLSARQNKVDYLLVEKFGLNYVVGTQRSFTNNNQLDMDVNKFVVDNYNYLLDGDSKIDDDLYDCDFASKEGSKGFVLYCTLGHMLEQATLYNNHQISAGDYSDSVMFTNLTDANLRMDMAGRQPGFNDTTVIENAFLAAAKACKNHKNDAAYDCWDENLDCAKLTYHQAQWFLLEYQGNPAADILPVSTAEDASHKLSFCHYHISCSGGHVPKAPTNWAELIKLAQDANGTGDDADNAKADLAILATADIEKITSLRANAAGGRYNATDKFVTDLTGAVKRLSDASLPLSWPNLQYAILNPGGPPDQATITKAAQDNYWWFDGSTSAPSLPTVTTEKPEAQWEYLLEAARATYVPSKDALKDGTTGWTTTTRLAPAQAPFTSNQSYSGAANAAWRNLTHNLVFAHTETQDDGGTEDDTTDDVWEYKSTKFADFDDFKDRLLKAVKALDPDGDKDLETDLTWEAVQEWILKDIDPGDDLGENKPTADTKFWWKNGNTPFAITNLRTLMEALRRVNEYDDSDGRAKAALDRLTVEDLEGEMFQTLRWSKTGQTVQELLSVPGTNWPTDPKLQKGRILDMLNQAREKIKNAPNVTENWNAVQYSIVHYAQTGTFPDLSALTDAQIRQETYYYWWYNKGTGTSITFTPGADALTNLVTMMEATYRIDFADPKALDSIVQAAQSDPTQSLWTLTRLISQKKPGTATRPNPDDNYDGPDTLDDVRGVAFPGANATDVQNFFDTYLAPFRDAAKAAQGLAADGFQTPEFYWHELQYYILNHTYKDYNDPDVIATMVNPEGDYWWYSADARELPKAPAAGYTPEEIAADLEFMKYANAALDGYLESGAITLTSKNANALNLMVSYNDAWSAPSLANLKKVLQKLGDDPEILNYMTDGKVTLSWAQLQYYLETAVKEGKGKYTKAGKLVSTSDAVNGLINEFGWNESFFPETVIKKPLATARSTFSRPDIAYAITNYMKQRFAFLVPTTTTTRRITA